MYQTLLIDSYDYLLTFKVDSKVSCD